MAQYIDKNALVAEIKRRKDVCNNVVITSETPVYVDYYQGKAEAYKETLALLDTLEAKEVDLDTDFGFCWGEYYDCGGNINDYEVAKHFFELGLKAQKGEEV